MKLLIVEDDRMLNDGITLSLKADADAFWRGSMKAVGGALSLVIGMIGVLNFINFMLTGILTRRREFAMLRSMGMTRRQLSQMLMAAD